MNTQPTGEPHEYINSIINRGFPDKRDELHESYLRIREMLGAWNTSYGGEDRFEVTERALKNLQKRLENQKGTIEERGRKIADQQNTILQLENRISNQKRELRNLHASQRQRNIEVDALGMVWCSGGCKGGMRRFYHHEGDEITEQMVEFLERNALRARAHWRNKENRKKYNLE